VDPHNTTYKNTTRRLGRAWVCLDLFGHQRQPLRGYGIYFVREDVGTVDHYRSRLRIFPLPSAGRSGSLSNFFSRRKRSAKSGVHDPNFGPASCAAEFPARCVTHLRTRAISELCLANGSAAGPLALRVVLTVPRDFKAPTRSSGT